MHKVLAPFVVAFLTLVAFLPQAVADKSADVVADLAIADGKLKGKTTLRVTQGQTVELRWTSDRKIELHLHGYDIEVEPKPGSPATMRFKAHASGRYPVTVHSHGGGHGEKAVLYLEVYPN